MKVWRTLMVVLAAQLTMAAGAAAQERAAERAVDVVVSGVVRDPAYRPVHGARVTVPQTDGVAWTDEAGGYRLRLAADRAPADGLVLRFEADGYRPLEVRIEAAVGEVRHDVVLTAAAVPLAAVAVSAASTAMPVRSASTRVESIDAAAAVDAGAVASVAELLQARAPGLSVFRASGTPGTASQVRIRGIHGAAATNDVAVYVDGIRIEDRPLALIDVGGQAVDGLAGLAPEDIASVEVLKGPASTLWLGPEAAGGAILLTTKRQSPGPRRFSQRLTLEYGPVEPRFDVPANWIRCGDDPRGRCATQPPDALLSDSPLERDGVLRDGDATALHWSGRASFGTVGAYGSLGWRREDGVLPNSGSARRGARLGLRVRPADGVELDVGIDASRVEIDLPINDGDAYSLFSRALMGNPTTVGGAEDGWWIWTPDSLALVRTGVASDRRRYTLAIGHRPSSWLKHRLLIGAERIEDEGRQTDATTDVLMIESADRESTRYTVDYRARLSRRLGTGAAHAVDLLLGVQAGRVREEASRRAGVDMEPAPQYYEEFVEKRRAEWDALVLDGRYAYRDRLFWEIGARLDRPRGEVAEDDRFHAYRIGGAYVAFDGHSRRAPLPWIGAVRLRAAYGVTERPVPSVIRTLWDPMLGLAANGDDAREERLVEIEAGLEAGTRDDRFGLGLTAFQRSTHDLRFHRSPSLGPNPGRYYVLPSTGAVRNRGLEARFSAGVLDRPAVRWTADIGVAWLRNEVLESEVTRTLSRSNRIVVGRPIGAFFTWPVVGVDTVLGRAILSDTAMYVGSILPAWEGSLETELALWRRLRIHALVDWRTGFKVENYTRFYRAFLGVTEDWARRDELSATERLARFGPYYRGDGAASVFDARADDIQDGSFLRLRELSATLEMPAAWAGRFGADAAQLTLAGRNVALWSAYGGMDPEALDVLRPLERRDRFTLPQVTRWTARLTVQF